MMGKNIEREYYTKKDEIYNGELDIYCINPLFLLAILLYIYKFIVSAVQQPRCCIAAALSVRAYTEMQQYIRFSIELPDSSTASSKGSRITDKKD